MQSKLVKIDGIDTYCYEIEGVHLPLLVLSAFTYLACCALPLPTLLV